MADLKPEIIGLLGKLEEKYHAAGQDLTSYLEGLLYNDFVKYWDYIELETLLSLQKTRTNLPDETIFITYHQITELYFKLCLIEEEAIINKENITVEFFTDRVGRINRYLENLIYSFSIMLEGMERDQFMKFRMSLLPASGFQSVQYRMIEIHATDFINLVSSEHRIRFNRESSSLVEMYPYIYWKEGANILATGKKTLTLEQFEIKYDEELMRTALERRRSNLWQIYKKLELRNENMASLKNALRTFDAHVNINWPLAHYRSTAKYLQKDKEIVAPTGGTNWQKYLPPRFQKRIFYAELWSEQEIADWGRGWVEASV